MKTNMKQYNLILKEMLNQHKRLKVKDRKDSPMKANPSDLDKEHKK